LIHYRCLIQGRTECLPWPIQPARSNSKTVTRPDVAWTPRTQRISSDSTMRDTLARDPRIPISRVPPGASNVLQRRKRRCRGRSGNCGVGALVAPRRCCEVRPPETVTISRKRPPDGVFLLRWSHIPGDA
jgi:hypothetical protein